MRRTLSELTLTGLMRLKESLRSASVQSTAADWGAYIRWQYESSAALFAKYPDFDVRGKSVLEIGCGTGGRTAYLATLGAARVVGVDINADEVAVANDRCPALFPFMGDRVTYLVTSDSDPLDLGQFDVVILVDSLEHVVSPPAILKLAYDYTRPGGAFYFSNIGWYHHHGAHVDVIPFANVFFSDETIINVERWKLRQPTYVPNRFDSDPPSARWDGVYNLRDRPGEHLNKITIREMKQLLKYAPFRERRLTITGFGSRNPLVRMLNPLRHVPIIQEAWHSLAIGYCRR